MDEIGWGDFEKVALCAGTVLRVEEFPEARKPAWKVWVDFGPHGVRKTSAQIRALYSADDGFATLAPVGKYEKGRSRFGPYDVVGNVWEWVADWYADYGPDSVVNPTGKPTGEKRVIRGGGWNGSFATWLRPSFRYAQDPTATSHGIGFRCAKSLGEKPLAPLP